MIIPMMSPFIACIGHCRRPRPQVSEPEMAAGSNRRGESGTGIVLLQPSPTTLATDKLMPHRDRIEAAAIEANAHDFIVNLPEVRLGYDKDFTVLIIIPALSE